MLAHAYLPTAMTKSLIVPLVKDKSGNLGSLANYRAIALSTTVSKLYEFIILERVKPELFSDDSQFGLKNGHYYSCGNAYERNDQELHG